MPGPAGQELRDRRRRTATLLSKYIKESAQAWDGETSANRLERSAAQTVPAAPEAPAVLTATDYRGQRRRGGSRVGTVASNVLRARFGGA